MGYEYIEELTKKIYICISIPRYFTILIQNVRVCE